VPFQAKDTPDSADSRNNHPQPDPEDRHREERGRDIVTLDGDDDDDDDDEQVLPNGWTIHETGDTRAYYHNEATGASVWTLEEDM